MILWQVALAFAFYIEGFLMENHRKHEPLDQTVHTLLVRCFSIVDFIVCSSLLRPGCNVPQCPAAAQAANCACSAVLCHEDHSFVGHALLAMRCRACHNY